MAFSEMRTTERQGGDSTSVLAGRARVVGGAWLGFGQSAPTMLGWRFPAEFRIRPAGWPAAQENPALAAEWVPASRPVLTLDAGLAGGVSADTGESAEAETALAIGEPCQWESQGTAPEAGRRTSYL